MDLRLERAAQAHSIDMGERRFFAHEAPDGTGPGERVRAAGWTGAAGENLAWGNELDATPARIMSSGWRAPGTGRTS